MNKDARFVQVVDVQDIMAAPAADVEKFRHGRWFNANNRKKTYQRRCSSCGEIAYYCGIGCSYKFCPNCGCCMDGGDD